MSSRSVSSLGVFTALVAALGFALSGVPNVELMTLSTFVSGALLGAIRGAIVGAGAIAIYSSFNPYGPAPPPVFVMQVLGYAFVGVVGGVVAGRAVASRRLETFTGAALGAVLGFGVTLVYDVITNLGTAWSMGVYLDPGPIVWGGLAFALWHMVWNAAFFAICAPPLLAAVRRRKVRSL
jgi:hypothetical protein